MRREFGVDEETIFEKWSYWQFKAYLAAIPKALGAANGTAQCKEDDRAGAIDTSEMDLEQLALLGLNVRRGPG
jgi:hypothetical protein